VTIEKDHELVERGPFSFCAASFVHWRVTGVRGSRPVVRQLGSPACYSAADWSRFHSPDECGGGCAFSRAGSALRRLHEAHQTACAFCLLRSPENCSNHECTRITTNFRRETNH